MKLRKDRREKRQREAQERQEAYDKLTPKQKMAKLDQKFGKGIGAKRQRERLSKQIQPPTCRLRKDLV